MLNTQRCIIRKFSLKDTDELYKILSDSEVMKFIEPPFTYEDTENFIVRYALNAKPLVWALEFKANSKIIGHVIFHEYEENIFEIGWILAQDYWQKGIASEVTEALIQYAKEENIASLIIQCDPAQEAAKHIALKNGFKLIEANARLIFKLSF